MPVQITSLFKLAWHWIAPNVNQFRSTKQPLLWILALGAGLLTAAAAIAFRVGIAMVQWPWIHTMSERVASAAAAMPAWVVIAGPVCGGFVVGLFLTYVQPNRRASAIADVIEAQIGVGSALGLRAGLGSAFVSVVSLGSGASAGREGPVVHLGATVSNAICSAFSLPASARRTLVACGVAGAISASFNTPIAGILFAHEVVLRHYALSALTPITIASVSGAVISRLWFGEDAAFIVPPYQITSYLEFPAFALLGIVCALVAILFQFALIGTDWVARNIPMKLWMRPVAGGAIVGAIGVAFPQILGVGYQATDQALHQQLPLILLLTLIFAKTAATAITLASRFGGGVVAPSLYLGAMTGGAFGIIAASVFPDMASSHGLYAILGMGAVAAAVLGAPISTAVMVFELTGGYALSVALLLTVSLAYGITQAIHGRSFFHWQLEMRGVVIQDGPHRHLVRAVHVRDFVTAFKPDDVLPDAATLDTMVKLKVDDTLEQALRTFDAEGLRRIIVVDSAKDGEPVGWAEHVHALSYFNSALIATSVEEHR
ncbi:MAG: chloride channel protein [Hyphomicrobiales bacterium]|nr:chloride channel protein [Hyphomicrobiales bacterium]